MLDASSNNNKMKVPKCYCGIKAKLKMSQALSNLRNYLMFYDAIKRAYPDVRVISDCDGSSLILDHPTNLFDFHVYTSAINMFSMSNKFDNQACNYPKVFVSEYAVTGNCAGKGSLLVALGEAGFLIGLEKSRCSSF